MKTSLLKKLNLSNPTQIDQNLGQIQDFVYSTLNNNEVQQYDSGIFNLDFLNFFFKKEGEFPLLSLKSIKENFKEEVENYFVRGNITLKFASDRFEKLFQNVFYLKIDDIYIGELATDGRPSYLQNQIKLSYNNQFLWENNHFPTLSTLYNEFGLVINSGKFDIAFDTNKDIMSRFQVFYDNCIERKFNINGSFLKPVTRTKYSNLNSNGEFIAGSTKSDKYFKMYNKTKEWVKSGKYYQSETHKRNGLDVSADVFRVELKFRGELLKDGFSWYDLSTSEGLQKIFTFYLGDSLSFYNLKNVVGWTDTRNEIYQKINLLNLPDVIFPEIIRAKSDTRDSKIRIVSTLRNDFNNWIESGENFERIPNTITNPLNRLDKNALTSENLFRRKVHYLVKSYPITRRTQPVDEYEIFSLNGSTIGFIYISPYHWKISKKAPEGFKSVN